MKQKIIIVGIGETSDIAFEYMLQDDQYDIVAFSVNESYIKTESHHNKPLVSLEKLDTLFSPNTHKTFVAAGSGHLNHDREKLFHEVKKKGYTCVSYISPHAFVWKTASIGENCFIFENNVIQHGVSIGDNVILWSGNHIGHQTKINNHTFISSHCVISGCCEIGEYNFLGVNCTFADYIKTGKDCFIGMGALVGKNLPDNTLIKPPKSEISKFTARQLCQLD